MSYAEAGTRTRKGVTLVELLVTLTMLALIMGIVGVSFGRLPTDEPPPQPEQRVAEARSEALSNGLPVTIIVRLNGREAAATAFPDGSVIADTALGIDHLSGRIARPRSGAP